MAEFPALFPFPRQQVTVIGRGRLLMALAIYELLVTGGARTYADDLWIHEACRGG